MKIYPGLLQARVFYHFFSLLYHIYIKIAASVFFIYIYKYNIFRLPLPFYKPYIIHLVNCQVYHRVCHSYVICFF